MTTLHPTSLGFPPFWGRTGLWPPFHWVGPWGQFWPSGSPLVPPALIPLPSTLGGMAEATLQPGTQMTRENRSYLLHWWVRHASSHPRQQEGVPPHTAAVLTAAEPCGSSRPHEMRCSACGLVLGPHSCEQQAPQQPCLVYTPSLPRLSPDFFIPCRNYWGRGTCPIRLQACATQVHHQRLADTRLLHAFPPVRTVSSLAPRLRTTSDVLQRFLDVIEQG